ncbi:GTPase HflX [Tepiditoga spiralis]|uniref:GTPase HflX n=1 Tax=Tepiditoga spiralis TaxID=2108365 RepID=A0A7G1G7R2_9BACT|nr:GTPase HflX [Tepiditoga spiralis]BBE30977.1 GTPase HflX [Tepiditoga spiralis]
MEKTKEVFDGILVAVNKREKDFEKQIEELKLLCSNIDINILTEVIQKKEAPDKKTYLGKGKIEELKDALMAFKCNIAIFNDSLSSLQRKLLEKELKDIKILDRNEIILEIFSRNAKTTESKLQVELASLTYELPKLVGQGISLSRTGGGIGTRGPGETQLEYNRRTIKEKINTLKNKLESIKHTRTMKSKKRNASSTIKVSITGYTSAGKSTLLKALSDDENILVSQKLFSTLATISRKTKFNDGLQVIFSDTVGFIRKLPISLIESFKTTLEEINYSDVIIEVIDLSEEDYEDKKSVVNKTLNEVIIEPIPRIVVFNKIDLLTKEKLDHLKILHPEALFVSAKSKKTVQEFLNDLEKKLINLEVLVSKKLYLKFEHSWKIDKIRDQIGIKEKKQIDDGFEYELITKKEYLEKIKSMIGFELWQEI